MECYPSCSAWVAFLVVFLTFGMETTFFHFLQKSDDKQKTFNQSFVGVLLLNMFFLAVILFGSQGIADGLLFPNHVEYIVLLGLVVCFDAVSALPLAKLRAEDQSKRFAIIQSTSILVNILLNLIFFFGFYDENNPEMGVAYVLIANLVSSGIKPLWLYKDYLQVSFKIDFSYVKSMWVYGFPLMIAGLAGIVNETIDRILLKHLLYDGTAESLTMADQNVGIYSACYKLAMLVTIFLQAYRYAAEPLFFAMSKDLDRDKQYRRIMNLLIAVLCLIFLVVTLNIDLFKGFIRNESYYEGLKVVPILLLANIFLGILYESKHLVQVVWSNSIWSLHRHWRGDNYLDHQLYFHSRIQIHGSGLCNANCLFSCRCWSPICFLENIIRYPTTFGNLDYTWCSAGTFLHR